MHSYTRDLIVFVKAHPAVVLLCLLLYACGDSPAQAQQQQAESEKRRWEVIAQQEMDVQACRDKGGVPVTKPSGAAWANEYRRELERCQFPCDARVPTQPQLEQAK